MALRIPAPRIRGRVLVPREQDGPALLRHVEADLLARECRVRAEGENRLVLESGAPNRYSPLSFVDGGTLWLAQEPDGRALRYDLSTEGGLLLCLILSPVCAAAGWFWLESDGLAVFGLLAPVLWLYGANYVLTSIRVPGLLAQLCRTAPGSQPVRSRGGA